jgi:uncharacterized protein DUF4124
MHRTRLLIILFLLQITTAYSEVYKWTDENGKTVYGDKPFSNSASEIKIKKPPEQDNYYRERYKKQQKLLNVMQEERDEKISSHNIEMEEKEKQQEKCSTLLKELNEMKNASHIIEDTDDPNNPRFISDEERKAEEERYGKYIKENC